MRDKKIVWKSAISVNLRVEEFEALVPEHLCTIIESEQFSDMEAEANNDLLQGITEWISPWQERQLSFGLDWYFQKSTRVMWARWTTLRTNVIVVDAVDVDQGNDCLHLCVALMMTRVRWEEAIIVDLGLYQLH